MASLLEINGWDPKEILLRKIARLFFTPSLLRVEHVKIDIQGYSLKYTASLKELVSTVGAASQ